MLLSYSFSLPKYSLSNYRMKIKSPTFQDDVAMVLQVKDEWEVNSVPLHD